MEANQLQMISHKLKSTNRKLLYIFFLNIADGILTYIGVSNNYTVEMNILMANIVSDLGRLIIIKLLLPSVMILFVAFIINKYKHIKMSVAGFFINVCFWVYLFIFFTHLLWIGLAIYYFLL